MKLRRLSKSQLLVLGAFLAAGATALPALAVRAAADPEPPRFPGGPYFVIGCGFSHMSRTTTRSRSPASRARRTTTPSSATGPSTRSPPPASLVGGASSCEDIGDSSAYWVPTLFAGGRALRPLVGVGYYVRRTPGPYAAFPPGLVMIAGNRTRSGHSRSRSSAGAAAASAPRPGRPSVPNCPPDRALHLRATFPGCWNGRDLDSADHKRHMAYASSGRCPRTHPVAVPSLVLIFLYPETEQRRLLQASGRFGAHADFMNGWNQETLEALVAALN